MRRTFFAYVLTAILASTGMLGAARLAAAEELKKELQNLGMPWEASYGYAQAVRVGDTVWVSGQLGHDDKGKLVGDDVESQMRKTYANINTLLKRYGLTMDNVVEETAFTTDLPSAAAARTKMGRDVYPDPTRIASNLIGVTRLFFPEQKVEIKVVAKAK